MTIAERAVDLTFGNAVTWAKVDTGFYVGSRASEFAGTVDTTPDGHFIGFDPTSAPIGRYESLREAQKAVEQWQPDEARERERERKLGRLMTPIAQAFMLVAMVTASAGLIIAL